MSKANTKKPTKATSLISVPSEPPFDPLHYDNIGEMIRLRLVGRELLALGDAAQANGAGIYALYYFGDFEHYSPLVPRDLGGEMKPIYVGKAIPRGGRKGLKDFSAPDERENALSRRLDLHKKKLMGVEGLLLEDFRFRYLPLTPAWIGLGENAMIRKFRPLWNVAVDGFGNNALGAGRLKQSASSWNVLHPTTDPTKKPGTAKITREAVLERVREYFANPATFAASVEIDKAERERVDAALDVMNDH